MWTRIKCTFILHTLCTIKGDTTSTQEVCKCAERFLEKEKKKWDRNISTSGYAFSLPGSCNSFKLHPD
ncbi:2479_t:CDS:2 [Entrophospora sp. SA101]|nr:18468_t:CDS:2 [Entrophospora sp. SA101]CAJ0747122.1 4057_t:CDS:2 [Entrophospora sp. SA101]CAJ0748219.1 2479_t:CDS:2 [Entrophospora sp. SA101]